MKEPKKLYCEKSYLERVKENYSRDGMMYEFLRWLKKKEERKMFRLNSLITMVNLRLFAKPFRISEGGVDFLDDMIKKIILTAKSLPTERTSLTIDKILLKKALQSYMDDNMGGVALNTTSRKQ